jgi:hypothetical protein
MSGIWVKFIVLWTFQDFNNCNYLKSFKTYFFELLFLTFKNVLKHHDLKLEMGKMLISITSKYSYYKPIFNYNEYELSIWIMT